jgi:Glucose-6-phosphate dehydrogenase subunit N-terminal domain
VSTRPSFVSHLGEEFPLSELMDRLRAEWARYRDDSDGPVTRIASFNLLVVSHGEDEERLENLLQGLLESHPARVIWTRITDGRRWQDSTARVHLGCRFDGEQVCSEEVQICCGQQSERVASLILPLIHAGLATHLIWWKSGPTEGTLFERLSDRSQLVIIEPNSWKDLAESLPELWLDPNRQEHAYYPLTWFQLTEARQKIASAYARFDIELALPKETNSSTIEADLLSIWIQALIPQALASSKGVRIVSTAEYTEPTLNWGDRQDKLSLESPLSAVRAALDRPTRDPVFRKMIDLIKEKDY